MTKKPYLLSLTDRELSILCSVVDCGGFPANIYNNMTQLEDQSGAWVGSNPSEKETIWAIEPSDAQELVDLQDDYPDSYLDGLDPLSDLYDKITELSEEISS
jgi:hypothetical protein